MFSCHGNFRYHLNYVRSRAEELGVSYWAVPHGSLDPWVFSYGKLLKRSWYLSFGKRFFNEARFVICATKRERDKLRHIHKKDNCVVVNWPVNSIDTSNRLQRRAAFREKWKIRENDFVFICVGRLHQMKRPIELLRAFAALDLDTAKLIFVGGTDSYTPEYLAELGEKHAPGRVLVTGPLYGREKEDCFLASDTYVSFSIRENFGHTAAEAIYCGLPAILSPGNDLSGEMDGIDFGWKLEDESLDGLRTAMLDAYRCGYAKLEEKGQNGAAFAREQLTYDRFQSSIVELRDLMCS